MCICGSGTIHVKWKLVNQWSSSPTDRSDATVRSPLANVDGSINGLILHMSSLTL